MHPGASGVSLPRVDRPQVWPGTWGHFARRNGVSKRRGSEVAGGGGHASFAEVPLRALGSHSPARLIWRLAGECGEGCANEDGVGPAGIRRYYTGGTLAVQS